MSMCYGVDGCPGGWVCARATLGGSDFSIMLYRRFATLLDSLDSDGTVAVDIPVGLTAAGPRDCDQAARRYLGFPRSASVFTAPIRPALRARSWEHACRIRERVDRKRFQRQAYGLFPKVREVDTLLRAHPRYQRQVFEAHPEVTFTALNGGLAMAHSKKRAAGRKERIAVIERCLGPGAISCYETACRERASAPRSAQKRGGLSVKNVARDDLIDALALVWTARRIARGEAEQLPGHPERDPMGIRMNIHY